MTTIWIYTGDRKSESARQLCKLGGFKRLRSGKEVGYLDFVLNWGSTQKGFSTAYSWLNHPADVAQACNKVKAFDGMELSDVSTVPWTTDQELAQTWSDEGSTVVVRNQLTGHSGSGIIIYEPKTAIPKAPLYTKYIFKAREFRVHVFDGSVIDTQQKIKDPTKEVVTWKVRSHSNGFIFARNSVQPNPVRDQLALDAVEALNLDFGAVDIIEDKKGNFYVLEVNTAPGLTGQTLTNYVQAIKQWLL